MSETLKLYRYEDYPEMDGTALVILSEVKVLKATRCGFWVEDLCGRRRFVLNSGRKRYAFPDKTSALASFKARKRRQILLLQTTLRRATSALEKASSPQFAADRSWGLFA